MGEHGHAYGLCKKIVKAKSLTKDKLLEKLNILLMSGGLTNEDYTELVNEINVSYTEEIQEN